MKLPLLRQPLFIRHGHKKKLFNLTRCCSYILILILFCVALLLLLSIWVWSELYSYCSIRKHADMVLCNLSTIAFACGFLNLVGFAVTVIPNVLIVSWNSCPMNLPPLSCII